MKAADIVVFRRLPKSAKVYISQKFADYPNLRRYIKVKKHHTISNVAKVIYIIYSHRMFVNGFRQNKGEIVLDVPGYGAFILHKREIKGQLSGKEEEMARRGENIRKRNDGRWEGRYMVKIDGKSRCRSVYAKSYLEVKEKLLLAKMDVSNSENPKIAKREEILFDTVAKQWLNQIKDIRKYSTFVKYSAIYNTHLYGSLGNLPVTQIDDGSIRERIGASFSDSTEKSIYCVLNQILDYGEVNCNMQKINLRRKGTRKKKETVQTLNLTEQTKLIRFLYQDMDIYKMGILLCLSTGLRLGEICALKWEDIDLELKILYVNSTVQRISVTGSGAKTKLVEGMPKTECSKREIPLSRELAELLLQFQSPTKYLLNGEKPMEPRTYQNKFKSYLKQAGLEDTNFHILRHTFATNCIDNGADVKSISEVLGHSDVKITLNRYVHPSVSTKRSHLDSLFSIYGQYKGQD